MQGQESPQGGETAPLTATNLQSISAVAQSDKGQLIHDFVNSQRLYLSRYSTEGRTVTAAWDCDSLAAGETTPIRKDRPREIVASAFDTPVLKPRVPLAQSLDFTPSPHGGIEAATNGAKASRSESKPPKASESKRPTGRAESRKENVPEEKSKRQNGQYGDDKQSCIPKQQTLDHYTAKAKTQAQAIQPNNKRRRSPDSSDSEHIARLYLANALHMASY